MPQLRSLALSLTAAAAVSVLVAAAPAHASAQERITATWVVQHLARLGGEELIEIGQRGDAFRAAVRRSDGRVSLLVIDARTGAIRPADQGDLLRNSIDLGVLDGLRGAFSATLPADAKPAHEIVDMLMATGKYRDLRSLRVTSGTYRVVMEDHAGAEVALVIDAVTGRLSGAGV